MNIRHSVATHQADGHTPAFPPRAPSTLFPIAPTPNARRSAIGITRHFIAHPVKANLKIAVLDDHPITAVGIASHLNQQQDFSIVHADTSAQCLLEVLAYKECDVAIIDFYLPQEATDGLAFLKKLRRRYPHIVVVSYSASSQSDTEYAAYRGGANAYLRKTDRLDLLPDIIRLATQAPQAFFSCREGELLSTRPAPPGGTLTCAEIEILRHIANGFSITETSKRLVRSKKTVSTHKRRAMRKLGLADDLALALYLERKFTLMNCV